MKGKRDIILLTGAGQIEWQLIEEWHTERKFL